MTNNVNRFDGHYYLVLANKIISGNDEVTLTFLIYICFLNKKMSK